MSLKDYQKKRDFSVTPEPKGKVKKSKPKKLTFVIQKHKATRLHYDLRLEIEGTLKSWAIPKGPSCNPAEKRLAVQVEDHPMDYGDFEGIIPEGNYGAGTVIVWDKGTYELTDDYYDDPLEAWKQGKLHVLFHGKKLQGTWILVRTKGPTSKDWLFFKKNDDDADPGTDITKERPESVKSGKTIEELEKKKNPRQWNTQVEKQLENFEIKEGEKKAMPRHIGFMLATLVDEPFDSPQWIYEIKYDGVRAMAYKKANAVRLLSRNDIEMEKRFPEITEALKQMPVNEAILDGEIVALDEDGRSSFQLLQPRMHLTRAADIEKRMEEIPVYFFLFDLLYCNGYLLTEMPLWKRREILKAALSNLPRRTDAAHRLLLSEHIEEKGKAFHEAAAEQRLEGILAKEKESHYESRRSRKWLKIRCALQQEFIVVGFTEPQGSRKYFGSLLLGLYEDDDLIFVGSSGGGFDTETLKRIHSTLKELEIHEPPVSNPPKLKGAHWVKPKLVAQVRFSQWTNDRIIRQPVFLGLREDKDPRNCVFELEHESKRTVRLAEKETAVAAKRSSVGSRSHQKRTSNPESQPFRTEHKIAFSNLDKVLWPEDGYTKRDLIAFYDRIGPVILPHLRDRPLNLERFPDGIHGESFYQKNTPDYFPDWIPRERIQSPDSPRAVVQYTICNNRDTLLYLANLACIPHNPWSSRVGSLDHPDFILFDLDPEQAPFSQVQKVALKLHELLNSISLDAYAKTSGATGIHVLAPLKPQYSYDDARQFSELVGHVMLHTYPKLVTLERVVKKRTGKVYIDFLQNVKGKTVVGPYVLRPRLKAPVSTPLAWKEIEKKNLDPSEFNIESIFKRLDKVGDLFEPVLKNKQSLTKPLQKLEELTAEVR